MINFLLEKYGILVRKIRNNLGSTSKVPRWAIAYKYPPEQKETKINNIITQVGSPCDS